MIGEKEIAILREVAGTRRSVILLLNSGETKKCRVLANNVGRTENSITLIAMPEPTPSYYSNYHARRRPPHLHILLALIDSVELVEENQEANNDA